MKTKKPVMMNALNGACSTIRARRQKMIIDLECLRICRIIIHMMVENLPASYDDTEIFDDLISRNMVYVIEDDIIVLFKEGKYEYIQNDPVYR